MVEDELLDEDAGWDDDAPDEGESSETAAAPDTDSPDDQDTNDDVDTLRQKVRSAEGRFKKFEASLDDMRTRLAEKEPVGDKPEPEPELALPEGWTQNDWDDFCADSPVEAELIEAQSRDLQALRQRVDTSEQQQQEQNYVQQFRSTVLSAHPDYDQLLATDKDKIQSFIQSQPNTLMKKAYQQVYEQGSAEEVVELVNQYKQSQSDPPVKPLNGDSRLERSLAIPSQAPVPDTRRKGGWPDVNDEDGAWDYFSDDAI